MYSVKVRNHDAVSQALSKISKRKGKTIPACQLQDGDLWRDREYELSIIHVNPDQTYSVFSAWSELLGGMCIGYGGTLDHLKEKSQTVTLLAHKPDYPQPDKESEVKTIVYPRPDGTVCCQNMVFYHSGQHFHITAERLADLKAKHDRDWLDSPTPCTCDLPLGQCREYDGKVHEFT